MKKIKRLIILSLVAFLLGGTIYFSLSVQDNPQENILTKLTTMNSGEEKSDTKKDVPEVKGENTLAYITTDGEEPAVASASPTTTQQYGTIQEPDSLPATGGGTDSLDTTKGGLIATYTPTPSPTIMQLPTQKTPVVTLPVAGMADDLGKMAVGAGALIIAAFLF